MTIVVAERLKAAKFNAFNSVNYRKATYALKIVRK